MRLTVLVLRTSRKKTAVEDLSPSSWSFWGGKGRKEKVVVAIKLELPKHVAFTLPTPIPPSLPFSLLTSRSMAGLPTLTSHQNRVLRLSFFSLGSLVILYVLFTLTSSSPTPEAAVPSSPHSSTSWSSAGSLLGFPPTPYPVWGLGEGGLMATDKGGINYHAGTGEYRWSEDHPWMKGKEHRRVMVASHFTAHEGK